MSECQVRYLQEAERLRRLRDQLAAYRSIYGVGHYLTQRAEREVIAAVERLTNLPECGE